MEIGCREGYALWVGTYDREKNPLIAVEEPHTQRLLGDLHYSRVLDAGAGTGRHALRLARQGARVTAIDDCPEMLAAAREAAMREGLSIDCRPASLEDRLPFKNAVFDLVVCALTLTHIRDLEHAMGEFCRVCAPGGHLLVTDFHPDHVAYGWRTEFRDAGGTEYRLPNMNHTVGDYLGAIEAAGFDLRQVVHVPVHEVPAGYLPDAVVRQYGHVNLCLVVLGQRPPADLPGTAVLP